MIHECKACGYRAGEQYDFDKKDFVYEDDEDFIGIKGSFFVDREDYSIGIFQSFQSSYIGRA